MIILRHILEKMMIEIVLDENDNDEFCGEKYPLVEINDWFSDDWEEYGKKAKQIIDGNGKNNAVIIKINNGCILNKLALALFTESFEVSSNLEYAVFKVKNLQKAREEYKPYVALTIAIKYALNLANETPKIIYKNISELGYLNIQTKQDFVANTMELSLVNSSEQSLVIEIDNLQDVLCWVAILKALSLAKSNVNIKLNIKNNGDDSIDKKHLVKDVVSKVSNWIN